MDTKILQEIFTRDLQQLKQEITSYTNEHDIWITDKNISNSAGNLCLHLIGNLNTYIGLNLGKTDYVRNRELEFSLKNVTREDMLSSIDKTIDVVNKALSFVTQNQLSETYPIKVFNETTTTEYMLIHLATHLTYHLGQINYHRRLLNV